MKKVLIAFDGVNYSEGAMEFAYKLNELNPIFLTGIFLPQTQLSSLWSYADAAIPLAEEDESDAMKSNIAKFEKECKERKIQYALHLDLFNLALPSLSRESVFADLLILASERFYQSFGTRPANAYLEEALHEVECPVVIVPDHFSFPEKIILAYDGSTESIFAIKQFAYLFPELCNRPGMLAYVSEREGGIPNEMNIKELVDRHFNRPEFVNLQFDVRKYFNSWIEEKSGAILVSGSFGRSYFSQLLKKSFVHEVIGDHKLPVFIAHK